MKNSVWKYDERVLHLATEDVLCVDINETGGEPITTQFVRGQLSLENGFKKFGLIGEEFCVEIR